MEFRTSADVLTKSVDYVYDVNDLLIRKEVDDDGNAIVDRAEKFVYDGGNIALVYDGAGSLGNRYLYGPALDWLFADENSLGEILWALGDNQGTIRDIVAYDGATDTTSVANHVRYDAFGNITGESNASVEFRHAYTGQEWDPDSGMYYYGARWYDALTALFASEDPSGFTAGDTNLYRYVENNPTNLVDPTGHDGIPPEVRAQVERDYREYVRRAQELVRAQQEQTRVERNRAITAAYAAMFIRDQQRYLWAGMAAYASNSVGNAMIAASAPDWGQDRLEGLMEAVSTAMSNFEATDVSIGIDVALTQVPDPDDVNDLLAEGNWAVYDDMYWQYLAYDDPEGGIQRMRDFAEAGILSRQQLAAWEAIERGDIIEGNRLLLRYEQEQVLQPIYDRYDEEALLLSVRVPSPIPGDSDSFTLGDGNIGDFDDRWDWISGSMFPAYEDWWREYRGWMRDDMAEYINRLQRMPGMDEIYEDLVDIATGR